MFPVLALGLCLFSGSRAADPWTLTGTNLNQTSWESQPYVANGYIGQRIPAQGMGYYEITPVNASANDGTSGWPIFDPRFTASMVAGFYDQQTDTEGTNFDTPGGDQPISTLPTWSPLYLTVNGSTYSVDTPSSQVANWSQSLSLQNGVVSTELVWTPFGNASLKLKYTLLAHRTLPNLGIVRLDVDNVPKGVNVTVTDVLDGAGAWRTTPLGSGAVQNTTDTIYSAVSPNGISNVTAYQVSHTTFVSGSKGSPVANTTSGCFSGVSKNASTAAQCYAVTPSSKKQLTIIKYVGIASSDAFPGKELSTAHSTVVSAAKKGYNAVLASHQKAWDALWADADIIVPGDEELQLAARASLFHLLSNVRQGSEGPGLGDNSIAPAGLTSDSYAGQVFWDADTWMFPSLLALFPSYAESITNFRYRQLGAAKENVKQFNRSGAIYPWTGARFGNCTGVGPCYDYEEHLNNDIALAQYQYYASTQNKTWLETKGWPIISAVAEFWASQVVYNTTTKKYDTLNETDPDEYANFRNNAAFTNAGISVIINEAIDLAKEIGVTTPSNWSAIAAAVPVLRDSASGITLEYDGFNGTTSVKQADVVLLPYPLEYNQTAEQGLNDLDFYALATSPDGPGMTYSIFSIDASALSPVGCASYTYLLAASQPYSRPPFYQFSEQTTDNDETNGGTNPAYTFLTGHGGFLQSFTHGFTGYRSRTNAFYLDPILPAQLTNYTLKGMKWRDSILDVTLTSKDTIIAHRKGGSSIPIQIGTGNAKAGNYTLGVGKTLVVPTRHTNGTLVEGNLAQCKSVLSTDTSFSNTNATIVPGQYALAAIDGSNATAWQPLQNSSATITVDLQASHTISKIHFNWGLNPATQFAVHVGNATDSMTQIANGTVSISSPYNATAAVAVSLKVGNTTDVQLPQSISARYVNVTIEGSYRADGTGATLAEFAVL
ncbi:carbohydrate-binding module family 32 protein [Plicaturopsis crispa FD-325 SS-3]|nr:carbohydrate-binding module family 32 protein [Plicaturopsis crispa FD-325 SS-3]